MRMIAIQGVRLDRPLSDLDHLIQMAKVTPYHKLTEIQRLRLKFELDMQHREREALRFAPIN